MFGIGDIIGGIGSLAGGLFGGDEGPPQVQFPFSRESALALAQLMAQRPRAKYRAANFPNAPLAPNYGELLRSAKAGGV